jgi:hypothetical protein
LGREPGIHNHRLWLWIPGSLAPLGTRNDSGGKSEIFGISQLALFPAGEQPTTAQLGQGVLRMRVHAFGLRNV